MVSVLCVAQINCASPPGALRVMCGRIGARSGTKLDFWNNRSSGLIVAMCLLAAWPFSTIVRSSCLCVCRFLVVWVPMGRVPGDKHRNPGVPLESKSNTLFGARNMELFDRSPRGGRQGEVKQLLVAGHKLPVFGKTGIPLVFEEDCFGGLGGRGAKCSSCSARPDPRLEHCTESRAVLAPEPLLGD